VHRVGNKPYLRTFFDMFRPPQDFVSCTPYFKSSIINHPRPPPPFLRRKGTPRNRITTHCKSTVRLFTPFVCNSSFTPPPTPFHPPPCCSNALPSVPIVDDGPPSLPSVPHEKFDQPPDCLYTFRLMTPCPISAVYQAQRIPCKTQFMPCNQRFYVAFRSYR
jgi:hypothetical protein